jgi:hypothetical protein
VLALVRLAGFSEVDDSDTSPLDAPYETERRDRERGGFSVKKNPVIDTFKKASKGLLFISETEAKFEPFAWPGGNDLTEDHLLKLSGAEEGTEVEQDSLDNLFGTVSKEDRPQFDKLAKVLNEQLTGIKVYKVGDEAEKDVYIVGKTADGQWAGLKTSVVET